MDTSPTMNLIADPPRSKSPPPDRNLRFTDTSTTPQYFSDFEQADDEVDYDSAEEDFSFAFWAPSQSKSPDITADELFSHGHILPIYPAFSKFKEDASTQDDMEIFNTASTSHPEMMSDRCEWVPKSVPSSPCRKSRSTGSARKWIFHDFLAGARSQSDGKEKFVFLEKSSTPQSAQVKAKEKATIEMAKAQAPQAKVEKKSVKVEKKDHKSGKKTEIDLATAYKSLYGLRRDKGQLKEGEKRKSFLPYFGFFGGGLNAFTKTSYPY